MREHIHPAQGLEQVWLGSVDTQNHLAAMTLAGAHKRGSYISLPSIIHMMNHRLTHQGHIAHALGQTSVACPAVETPLPRAQSRKHVFDHV